MTTVDGDAVAGVAEVGAGLFVEIKHCTVATDKIDSRNVGDIAIVLRDINCHMDFPPHGV